MSRLKFAPPPPPEPEVQEEPAAAVAPAKAPTPAPRPAGRLGAPPTTKEAPANLHLPSDGYVDLNFKVDPAFRQTFKMEAVRRGMSNREFLESMFKHFLDDFPSTEGIIELREPTPEQRSRRIQLRKERATRMAKIRERRG